MRILILCLLTLGASVFAAEFEKQGGKYVYRDTLTFDESVIDVTILECESVNGTTKITGEDRTTVHVTVYIEIKAEDLEEGQEYLEGFRPVVAREGSKIRVYGEYPDSDWTWNDMSANMDFVVLAPRGLNLDASSANGEITCTGMNGEADLECANGEISFMSESGSPGSISASCANGEIKIDVAQLNAASDFSCANGEIDVIVRQILAANVSASTANGEIRLAFPENSSMKVTASSLVNGSIRSDWSGQHEKNFIGDNYELVVNDGKYLVECSSANGEIEILKSNRAD